MLAKCQVFFLVTFFAFGVERDTYAMHGGGWA